MSGILLTFYSGAAIACFVLDITATNCTGKIKRYHIAAGLGKTIAAILSDVVSRDVLQIRGHVWSKAEWLQSIARVPEGLFEK